MKLLCILSQDFAETLYIVVGEGHEGLGQRNQFLCICIWLAGMQIQMKLTPCPAVLAAFI